MIYATYLCYGLFEAVVEGNGAILLVAGVVLRVGGGGGDGIEVAVLWYA